MTNECLKTLRLHCGKTVPISQLVVHCLFWIGYELPFTKSSLKVTMSLEKPHLSARFKIASILPAWPADTNTFQADKAYNSRETSMVNTSLVRMKCVSDGRDCLIRTIEPLSVGIMHGAQHGDIYWEVTIREDWPSARSQLGRLIKSLSRSCIISNQPPAEEVCRNWKDENEVEPRFHPPARTNGCLRPVSWQQAFSVSPTRSAVAFVDQSGGS